MEGHKWSVGLIGLNRINPKIFSVNQLRKQSDLRYIFNSLPNQRRDMSVYE